jgi:hypothetical protein
MATNLKRYIVHVRDGEHLGIFTRDAPDIRSAITDAVIEARHVMGYRETCVTFACEKGFD